MSDENRYISNAEREVIYKRAYHWASIKLSPGSIIEPGNWGRMLKRYSMPSSGTQGFGNPWILAREIIFESVRIQNFPTKPARLEASFTLLSIEDALAYRKNQDHHQLNILYEVELLDPDAAYHLGAMEWTNWPSIGLPFMDNIKMNAVEYFNGNGNGLRELVSRSPLRVIAVCEV